MPRWLLARGRFGTGMLLAFPALLPFGGLYNVPLLAFCGLGLWCLVSRPHEVLRDEGLRLLLVLFPCIFILVVVQSPLPLSRLPWCLFCSSLICCHGVCFVPP